MLFVIVNCLGTNRTDNGKLSKENFSLTNDKIVNARAGVQMLDFWPFSEVLGAFASVLLIWVITGVLVFMAIQTIINRNYEINGIIMVITASLGVTVNLM